jgi:dipeptidyl aminopeptidase/acylaminoacyl peptidase
MVRNAAFSPDGQRLASAGDDNTVRVWDAASGQELHTLKGHAGAGRATDVALSPDGQRLASANGDGTVTVWDAVNGRELGTLEGYARATPSHARGVFSVAFSPDGRWLASGCYDGTVKVWGAANLQELHTFRDKAHAPVQSVAFSPDSQRLASAGASKTVAVWDVASGQELPNFKGYANAPVHRVAFSPDGQRLALGCGEDDKPGEVKIWDAATGKELLTLKGHTNWVNSVAFSPDGLRLASAGWDGTVKVWDARPLTPEVRAEAEARDLVAFLFAKPLAKEDVVQGIQDHPAIREAVRKQALALAERFREEQDPKRFDEASRALVRQRYLAPRWYQQALQQAQTACRLKPGEGAYLSTLGLAQYRLGEYAEALKTLTRSDRLNTASPQGTEPAALAFLAMAQHQLGQQEQAQATLAKLGELVKKPAWAQQEEAQSFLREAVELIEGKPAGPEK